MARGSGLRSVLVRLKSPSMRPAAALQPVLNAYLERIDPTLMAQIMGRGFGLDASERAINRRACRQGRQLGRKPEFIDRVAALLPGDDLAALAWPSPPWRSTMASSWSGTSVPACCFRGPFAASCAGPGVFPPVEVGGRRYIDGGVRSPTNADRAAGYERVLVITASRWTRSSENCFTRRRLPYGRAGAKVLVLLPDEASSTAIGPDRFDVANLEFSVDRWEAPGAIGERDPLRLRASHRCPGGPVARPSPGRAARARLTWVDC